MVHCRMSALGRVVGSAETVVRALLDAPALQEKSLQLATVHAYAPLPDADRRQLAALDQFVRPSPRQTQKLRRLRYPHPFCVSLCIHNPPVSTPAFSNGMVYPVTFGGQR
jgi:aminoglycoside N3'-acetyltransferase